MSSFIIGINRIKEIKIYRELKINQKVGKSAIKSRGLFAGSNFV
jgi:hypothetical protein